MTAVYLPGFKSDTLTVAVPLLTKTSYSSPSIVAVKFPSISSGTTISIASSVTLSIEISGLALLMVKV